MLTSKYVYLDAKTKDALTVLDENNLNRDYTVFDETFLVSFMAK